jgi:hypothetical protein
MSNTDFDFPDPGEFMQQELRRAQGNAIVGLEANPDDAVRAQQLSQATGLPAPVVLGDLDHYDNQSRVRMTSALLENNPELQAYVNSDPLAASVSNDDYGQLDATSASVKKYGGEGILSAAMRGFKENFDAEGADVEYGKYRDWLAQNPAFANVFIRHAAEAAGIGLNASMRLVSGVVAGGAAGIGEIYKQAGGNPAMGDRLTRDLIIAANVGMSGQGGLHAVVHPEVRAMVAEASKVAKAVEPYALQGKEPPVGLHPIVDELKIEQVKTDVDSLKEALKESAASATRERSPELFADFIRQHTDAEVGISADAVRELYGDKIPKADDGILGWVPKIEEQLAIAEATGGDVRVPVADLLAKMEPEVFNQIKDRLRTREAGITVEEAKGLPKEEAIGEPIEDLRRAHGFQPKNAVTISRMSVDDIRQQGPIDPQFSAPFKNVGTIGFDITGGKGEILGELYITQDAAGKRLYVENISSEGPGKLGAKAIRGIAEQIKAQFPEAEVLEGIRVSGAREYSGSQSIDSKASLDLTKIKPRVQPKQLELPAEGTTRLEDRKPFEKAAAIGMTEMQYGRYQKLIEKRAAEDADHFAKRALDDARRRQTAEWRANEVEVRKAVVEDFKTRRDFAADDYFRIGELYGEKVGKPKIAEDALTPEQRAVFPADWIAEKGLHPDDAAALLGYPSAADMITEIATLHADRATTRPMDFRRRLIAEETERRMEERYGHLADNIAEEAKERVLSQTQIDILHEDTLAAATQAGLEFSIPKEGFLKAIKERFEDFGLKAADSDRLLADAGRANRAAEMALLKSDFQEAFRQKQRGYIAGVLAREALTVESLRGKLDKTAKHFEKREVKGIEQESVNFIQKLLQEAGYPVRLTKAEIGQALEFEGTGTLIDYVARKEDAGWAPEVSGTLQELGAKPLEEMTVAEFREFKDAIDSLAYIGREESKINIAGEKQEFADFRAKVVTNLQTLPPRPREKQGRWLYELDASLTRMEELVKDLDLQQELGPLYRAVIEPMMASKTKEFDLLQDLSNHFKQVKGDFGKRWRKSLQDTIPQDFLIDPYTGTPYDLTRENLIQVMLNFGNRSNIQKLSQGYASLELGRKATREEAGEFAGRLKDLIDRHATKEDWDFVQQMWAPFKKFQVEADTVSRNVSGVAPKWIESEKVQTPHGEFDGGYWPVKYDRLGSNMAVIEDKKPPDSAIFGQNYFRAATSKGHLKERTGYIDAVDITSSLEQAAGVMQQTIHDIAFRDSLVQAGKVFYDKEIRAAIRKHYGVEYEAQLIPWLKRIANKNTVDERAIQFYNDWQRRVRVNLIGHALPLNLKVILSPDIGVPDPKAWASFEANRSANVALAMEKSNEIRHLVYNMDRDYREQLERAVTPQGVGGMQKKAVQWAFLPMMKMSQEFRMSTFVDQYAKAKGRGLSDHEASVVADSFVRERHGAASIVDLPAIMESTETMKSLTMFYGYFNTMYNWQRQLPGNVRRGEVQNFAVNALGSVVVGAGFGAALFNQAKEGDSWWKTVGKALLLQPLSTIPIVREFANYFVEGYAPRSPTAGLISALSAAYTDLKHFSKGEPMKKPIATGANIVGVATGLPLLQVGRTGQFLSDVHQRKQRPRNFPEWARGIISGQARLKP